MPTTTMISDEDKASAVRLYQEGAKTDAIYQETGVSRPALYLLLRQRGISPNRQSSDPRFTPGLDASAIQARLEDALVQLGAARNEIERLKQQVSILEGELEDGPHHAV